MNCTKCGTANTEGHAFCSACGTKLGQGCAKCGASLAPGAGFCTSCGTAVAGAKRSVVAEGVWVRDPSEFVRRVSRDELRQAFGGTEVDGFLAGTLVGRLLDALMARTVRVPMGSVGALVRDGKVVRVLPPGDQVTASVFRELVRDAGHALTGTERASLYLVDRRPLPIGTTREVAVGGTLVTVDITATFSPGSSADALGGLITTVVRDRDSLTGGELFTRLSADLEQAVTDALRASPDLPTAERATRKALEARTLVGSGLSVEVVFARKDTHHRRDVTLGAEAPAERPCPSCGKAVGAGQRFCTSCGASQDAGSASSALVTRDGTAIVVDLALSITGDTAPTVPTDALRAALAAHLRGRTFAEVASTEGFLALEAELTTAATEPLLQRGHRLVSLDVVDVRSAQGQWTLGARAAMTSARQAAAVGREWLAVKDDERAVEALTLASVRAQQQLARDHGFAQREAAVADQARQVELDAQARSLKAREREATHTDTLTASQQAHARELAAATQAAELERTRLAAESERRRVAAEDQALAERLRRESRLEELRGLSAIDADIAEREHRQELERMARLEGKSEAQILAMQASRLASQEHGAAFAEALGKLADGDAARRERERADARLDAKDERTTRLMEKMLGSAKESETVARTAYQDVAETTKDMAKTAVASHAQVAAAVARACVGCGVSLAPTARFCGVCGTTQP